ncbi:MAG: hypothetical protein K0A90_08870, partial [Methanosarcinaceae archaeon]|nr:hypothetical protein [Methanosarcinaceae archaeon]
MFFRSFFRSFFYCKKCGSIANDKICPHPNELHIDFSGSNMRDVLVSG